MFRKRKSAVEGDPEKSWNGIEAEEELKRKRWSCRLAWWRSTNKKEALHLLGLRGDASTQTSAAVKLELLLSPPS